MKVFPIDIECTSGCYLKEKCIKQCEISAAMSLNDLCEFILSSFDFDNDHMHEFFVSKTGRPYSGNELTNEEMTLDEIFPTEKGHFLFFHFDFGDDWVFKIKYAKRLVSSDNAASYPRVINSKGKNPVQYPDYEEEYD